MDNDEILFSIFLDLSKAFDTIDNKILLEKLKYCGIEGISFQLFKSYLSDRKQYVDINDAKSDVLQITTGVPQGSSKTSPLLIIKIPSEIFKLQAKSCHIQRNHRFGQLLQILALGHHDHFGVRRLARGDGGSATSDQTANDLLAHEPTAVILQDGEQRSGVRLSVVMFSDP